MNQIALRDGYNPASETEDFSKAGLLPSRSAICFIHIIYPHYRVMNKDTQSKLSYKY